MSQSLISLSPDLRRLNEDGFEVSVEAGHLVVRGVPYVNACAQSQARCSRLPTRSRWRPNRQTEYARGHVRRRVSVRQQWARAGSPTARLAGHANIGRLGRRLLVLQQASDGVCGLPPQDVHLRRHDLLTCRGSRPDSHGPNSPRRRTSVIPTRYSTTSTLRPAELEQPRSQTGSGTSESP